MKIYDYILKSEKIEPYNKDRVNSARFIVEVDIIDEFIVPKTMYKTFLLSHMAEKYVKEHLNKNPKEYYFISTNFDCGLHCIYIEKVKLNQTIEKLKVLDFQWTTPFYFAMEIIEERCYRNGKLYMNIGEYIYRLEVYEGNVITYHCYLKEGYYSKDMKKIDFFKKSLIWMQEDENGCSKET